MRPTLKRNLLHWGNQKRNPDADDGSRMQTSLSFFSRHPTLVQLHDQRTDLRVLTIHYYLPDETSC